MATASTKKPESTEAKPTSVVSQPAEDRPLSLSTMRDEFDRWFHRLTRNWPSLWQSGSNWRWGIELDEKDEALTVKAEAPGFEQNDFDINVDDHRVVIKAARKSETKDKDGTKIEERQCCQSIALPCDIDKEKVEATYHNGILTVTMPKAPGPKARKIPVQKL